MRVGSREFGEAQFREDSQHIWAGRLRFYIFVDLLHDPFLVDVDGPTIGVELIIVHYSDAIELGHGLGGVAQERELHLMLFGESLILIDGIDARHEVGHIELSKLFFAVTQRF